MHDSRAVATLRERIARKRARIAVVGLGYVGIPVAASFATSGFSVVGIDTNESRVQVLRSGSLPLAESEPGLSQLVRASLASGTLRFSVDPRDLESCEIFIVAVDTPIDSSRRPDTTNLQRACETIASRFHPPAAIIIESTLAPGTMRGIVAGAFTGSDPSGIFLIHCPERVRPGRLLKNIRSMERLVGADDPETAALAVELYAHIVQAGLVTTTWETAEVIKTAENAARDVQIALANQLAVISDYVGVDVRIVRDHINRLWSNEPLVLVPGPGVGGYCLPKDPWLLTGTLPEGAPADLVEGARALNDAMPRHVMAIVLRACDEVGVPYRNARVAVLGLTYQADSDDQRNAPGPRLVALLREIVGEVLVHDPYVTPDKHVLAVARDADVIALVVSHTAYRDLELKSIGNEGRRQAIVDCWRIFDGDLARSLQFAYFGLGVGALNRRPPQQNAAF